MSTDDTSNPDVTPDSLEFFVADLRRLRDDADKPTLAKLSYHTNISKTVLSEAFVGRKLPTARTVEGIVRFCDGDVAAWLKRRDSLDADRPASTATTPFASREPLRPGPRRVRLSTALWVGAAACVLVAVVTGVGTAVVAGGGQFGAHIAAAATAPATAPVTPLATTGDDAADTSCVDDAKVVASESRAKDTVLQIVYSNTCRAAWARVTRYDDLAMGNSVTVSIFRELDPNGPDRQSATELDVQGAYTTLIVREKPDIRLCAVGSITENGQNIDLGKPICL